MEQNQTADRRRVRGGDDRIGVQRSPRVRLDDKQGPEDQQQGRCATSVVHFGPFERTLAVGHHATGEYNLFFNLVPVVVRFSVDRLKLPAICRWVRATRQAVHRAVNVPYRKCRSTLAVKVKC